MTLKWILMKIVSAVISVKSLSGLRKWFNATHLSYEYTFHIPVTDMGVLCNLAQAKLID